VRYFAGLTDGESIPGLRREFGRLPIIAMRFNESIRLLEEHGFRLVKEKGSIPYYGKPGLDKLIRVDYHASKEVSTGTCHAILKAAGIRRCERIVS